MCDVRIGWQGQNVGYEGQFGGGAEDNISSQKVSRLSRLSKYPQPFGNTGMACDQWRWGDEMTVHIHMQWISDRRAYMQCRLLMYAPLQYPLFTASN